MPNNFQPTQWSLIRRAVETEPAVHERAWKELHRLYREPLLWFIRRAGWPPEQAEDLLQSFFATMAHREWLSEADPELGKMRTFLLSRLKTHLNDARKHDQAIKRGGRADVLSMDDEAENGALMAEANVDSSEELTRVFDRRWAKSILDRALARLEEESKQTKNRELFKLLRAQLTGASPERHKDAAARLGQTEGALRVGLHRLRERFRSLMREQVADTLLPADDVSAEVRYLAEVLSAG
jgi:RNA polymerase sigma factor (sigma-70 family)